LSVRPIAVLFLASLVAVVAALGYFIVVGVLHR
jgi:hypothetical protein